METKRLEILKKSLTKKEALFNEKLQQHFDTVKEANGQPLNDKRNGKATLNKWEKQNQSLVALKESIEKTKQAIEIEELKITSVESAKETFPPEILNLIQSGELTQWRKYPNTFFVSGVDKARIIYDNKKNIVGHKYSQEITDKEQWARFAKIFNSLRSAINSR
jgi:hypothetical protein